MNRRRALVVAILALALGVRLAHFGSSLDDPYLRFRVGDEQSYHLWAERIAAGGIARGRAFFTTPLYAYVLGAAYRLGLRSVTAVRFLNLLLGVATTWLVYLTARRSIRSGAAVIAPIVFGLSVTPLFYETFPEKTSLVVFLTALAFFLIVRARPVGGEIDRASRSGGRSSAWIVAGIAVGLATLAHTFLLVFVPVVSIALLLERAGWPRRLGALVAFGGGVLIGVAPATIHNYVEARDLVLVNSNGGATFYIANHAGNPTGHYTSPRFAIANVRSEEDDFAAEAERRTGRAMRPSEVSDYWYRQGLTEMAAHPGLTMTRIWRRLRWSVGNEELTDARTFEFYRERLPWLGLPLWTFGAGAFLGLLGAGLTVRDERLRIFIVFVPVFCLGLSLYLVYGRYRLPLLIPLSILAAAAVDRLAVLVRERRRAALALAVAATLPLGWIVFTRVLGTPVSFFTDYYNQGNRYYNAGRYDLAIAEYEKALTVKPGEDPGVEGLTLGLAGLYVRLGQPAKAEALLTRALEAHPHHATFEETLATLRHSR